MKAEIASKAFQCENLKYSLDRKINLLDKLGVSKGSCEFSEYAMTNGINS